MNSLQGQPHFAMGDAGIEKLRTADDKPGALVEGDRVYLRAEYGFAEAAVSCFTDECHEQRFTDTQSAIFAQYGEPAYVTVLKQTARTYRQVTVFGEQM